MCFHRTSSPAKLHLAIRRILLPLGLAVFLALHAHMFYTGTDRLVVALHEAAYALICCWLIMGAEQGFGGLGGRLLELRSIVYLGRISYGIYAYHLFVPWALRKGFHLFGAEFPARGASQFVLASAVTVLLAMASWHFMESPINRLKRYFPYGRRQRPQQPDLAPASLPAGSKP
jgi:peptidoglycan/LPS O-acetylase OafA/YrhL